MMGLTEKNLILAGARRRKKCMKIPVVDASITLCRSNFTPAGQGMGLI
jgi:hypothetical protein